MSTIQLRIDADTKKKAQKTLEALGLDMSSAIKLYLKQIVIKKGIPFELLTENNMSPSKEKQISKASKEAKEGKNISNPMSIKETVEYLNSL